MAGEAVRTTTPCRVSIGRPGGNTADVEDGIARIEIQCNESKQRWVVEMPLKEFALAITGMGQVRGSLEKRQYPQRKDAPNDHETKTP